MEQVTEYIAITAFIIIGFLLFVVMPLSFIKIDIASKHHIRICHAIFSYHKDVIKQHDFDSGKTPEYEVDYDDLEDLEKTINRFWDWGYKRILPKEKFEIIKPYLEVRE